MIVKAASRWVLAVVAVVLLAGTWSIANAAGATAGGIAGIYAGSTTHYRYPGPTASKSSHLFGAVTTGGNGYFVSVPAPGGSIRVFRNLAGTGRITSPEYEVPAEGQGPARGSRRWKLKIQPAAEGLYAIHGKFGDVSGYVALDLKMQSLTHRNVSLDAESGVYLGTDINRGTKATITLSRDGQISGAGVEDCSISGTLIRVGKLDLFDAHLKLAGSSACHGTMRGLAFFDTHDRSSRLQGTAGSYLYLIGVRGDLSDGFAMVLSRHEK